MPTVRFTRPVQLELRSHICCFSGEFELEVCHFQPGDELAVLVIWPEDRTGMPKRARKRKPARATLVLDNERATSLHPDRYVNVPQDCYQELT